MEKSKASSGGGGGGGGGAINGDGGDQNLNGVFNQDGGANTVVSVPNCNYKAQLNPMAEEFVPPSLANSHGYLAGPGGAAGFGFANNFAMSIEVVQFCETYNLVQF
ncbi:hypothetical protein AHAS_Ahas14G0058400 [Arachis hypogaea]